MTQIYLISPEVISDLPTFIVQLEEIFALQTKPALFQLRLKNISNHDLERAIMQIKPICEKCDIPMILNDNISLALKHDIGVHVGGDDANFGEMERFKHNSNRLLGVSCYNSLERAKAFESIADYISFGAMFPSKTKSLAPACEQSTIMDFRKTSTKKVSIIGGITAENIHEIDVLPYIDYLCVISSVWTSA